MGEGGDERVDVLVIGAGISGIDAAYHLQTYCPGRTYAILEGRERLGGTWDLFRYPGVRSDSDMHTLGFGFKPWKADKAIADGPSILAYLQETVDEHGIGSHIRYRHVARRASWSSADAEWTVEVDHDGDDAHVPLPLPVRVRRLLQLPRRLRGRAPRHRPLRRAASCTRRRGRTTSSSPASASSSSGPAPRR